MKADNNSVEREEKKKLFPLKRIFVVFLNAIFAISNLLSSASYINCIQELHSTIELRDSCWCAFNETRNIFCVSLVRSIIHCDYFGGR